MVGIARQWVALLAVTAFAAPAFAQEGGDTSGKAEFEKASRFFEAGEYEVALPYFEEAYDLSGHRPSTIQALAQCERALSMYERAIEHYREYLATSPDNADQISETITLLEELERERKKRESEMPPEEEPAQPIQEPPPEPKPEAAAPETVVATAPPPAEEDGLLESPVFWGVVAGVAVLGGALTVVALSSGSDPYGGTTDVVIEQ